MPEQTTATRPRTRTTTTRLRDRRRSTGIRVLVVDDHQMMAHGLMVRLDAEPDLDVIGTTRDLATTYEVIERQRPDVVVLDFDLPMGDGADGTEVIKASWPEVKVLMLCGRGDDVGLVRALQCGCDGFLRKSDTADDLISAVRRVHAADLVFSNRDLAVAIDLLGAHLRDDGPHHSLSTRELEVLRLLADGCSTHHIAERLDLSIHTVRSHVRHIIEKLDVHSKLEAVVLALQLGIIARPTPLPAAG